MTELRVRTDDTFEGVAPLADVIQTRPAVDQLLPAAEPTVIAETTMVVRPERSVLSPAAHEALVQAGMYPERGSSPKTWHDRLADERAATAARELRDRQPNRSAG